MHVELCFQYHGEGGLGKTISNDNLVELMVQLVKKKLREQGSNFTYANEVKAVLPSQVQDEVKNKRTRRTQAETKGNQSSEVLRGVDFIN